MTLQYSVLASGSTGNSFFVGVGEDQYLVDAGLSGKQLEGQLEKVQQNIKNIKGIFITHEHVDHIKGIGIVARKHNIPILANERTWKAMEDQIGKVPIDCIQVIEHEKEYSFGLLDVMPFRISHDAAEPMGYVFHHNNKKLVFMTDTGYVNQRMKDIINNANTYVFESNHDVRLLQMGRYPWHIKKRILSDSGHLSNEDSAIVLSEVIGENTNQIYLAHLSQDHNLKDLASTVCKDILLERNEELAKRVEVNVSDPKEPTLLATVK